MTITQRVGRIPVALALIAYGAVKVADTLTLTAGATNLLLKLWPVLLIAMGAEYLIRSVLAERHVEGKTIGLRFDFGGTFLLLVAVLLGTGIGAAQNFVQTVGLPFSDVTVFRTDSRDIPASGVKTLELSTLNGRIELRPGNADVIRIEATYNLRATGVSSDTAARQLDQMAIRATGGEVVTISSEGPTQYGYVSTNYVVHAPAGLQVVATTASGMIQAQGYNGDLRLTSTMGPIRVSAGTGSLTAKTESGAAVVTDFSGPVTVRTTMGRIDTSNTTGSLRLEAQSGSVVVQDYRGGSLDVHTSMGPVRATTNSALAGDVSVRAESGSISLSVPRESSMQVTARTRSGSLTVPPFVNTSRDGLTQAGSGTAGEGKYKVDLEATMGSVTLLTR